MVPNFQYINRPVLYMTSRMGVPEELARSIYSRVDMAIGSSSDGNIPNRAQDTFDQCVDAARREGYKEID